MLINPFKIKEREQSDFGRKYGWNVIFENRLIANLDYLFWDPDSQFWHVYKLNILCSEFEEKLKDPDFWTECKLSSIKYSDCIFDGVLASIQWPNVSIRSVFVDDKFF